MPGETIKIDDCIKCEKCHKILFRYDVHLQKRIADVYCDFHDDIFPVNGKTRCPCLSDAQETIIRDLLKVVEYRLRDGLIKDIPEGFLGERL